MMDPDFGVGLQQLLFENEDDNIYPILNERIQTQVSRYMSFLDIINVETGFEEHTLHVKIDYFISALGISDALSVDVVSSK